MIMVNDENELNETVMHLLPISDSSVVTVEISLIFDV